MPHKEPTDRILQRELAVLRVLCVTAHTNLPREKIIQQLSEYVWQGAEHRVVFEAIARLCSSNPSLLREQLPAQATRMGFPDVNWESYFGSQKEAEDDIEELVRALIVRPRQSGTAM